MSKPTMRITSINMYRSNAEIFANGNGIEYNCFNVDFEDVSGRARYSGGDVLKRFADMSSTALQYFSWLHVSIWLYCL